MYLALYTTDNQRVHGHLPSRSTPASLAFNVVGSRHRRRLFYAKHSAVVLETVLENFGSNLPTVPIKKFGGDHVPCSIYY
jgi:hypothetical protein